MSEPRSDAGHEKSEANVLRRLARMLAAGKISAEDATRLRAAAGSDRFEDLIREVRVRHATERLDAAVSDGRMSREEADAAITQLREGGHGRYLRGILGRLTRVRGRSGPGVTVERSDDLSDGDPAADPDATRLNG